MAVQPVGYVRSNLLGSFIELQNSIIINGITYDLRTLAIKEFMPIKALGNFGWSDVNNYSIISPAPKAQFAQYAWWVGRRFSALMVQPNLFTYEEVGMGLDFPKTLIRANNNSGSLSYYILPNETYNVLEFDSTNISERSSFVKINDTNYLWNMLHSYYSRTYSSRVYRIDTNTGNVLLIHDWKYFEDNCRNGQYIGKSSDGTKFFFTTQKQNGHMRVSYYNYSNQTFTHLTENVASYTSASVGYFSLPSRVIPETANTSVKKFYYIRPVAANDFQIVLVSVDVDNATVTYTNCTVNKGSIDFYVNNWNDSNGHAFIPILHKYNDDYYLSFWQSDDTRIWTFKVNKDANGNYQFDNLSFFSQTQKVRMYSYIALDNTFNRLIDATPGLMTLTFTDQGWVINYNGIYNPDFVYYDTLGRLWIRNNTDNSMYLLIPSLPTNVVYTFEKDSYQYTGSNIDTFVRIAAYNYQGQRIATSGTLKIVSGNATFTDGTIQKQITTSTTSDTLVNFTITGPGLIKLVYDITVS